MIFSSGSQRWLHLQRMGTADWATPLAMSVHFEFLAMFHFWWWNKQRFQQASFAHWWENGPCQLKHHSLHLVEAMEEILHCEVAFCNLIHMLLCAAVLSCCVTFVLQFILCFAISWMWPLMKWGVEMAGRVPSLQRKWLWKKVWNKLIFSC